MVVHTVAAGAVLVEAVDIVEQLPHDSVSHLDEGLKSAREGNRAGHA